MNDLEILSTEELLYGKKPTSKRKRQLTYPQKIWLWENRSHTCHLCDKRILKFSHAEFDHSRAFSKGGATNLSNVKLAHRECNRIRSDTSRSTFRRSIGIKTTKKRRYRRTSQESFNDMFMRL